MDELGGADRQVNKPHFKQKAGKKVLKKQAKDVLHQKKTGKYKERPEIRNPKAFGFQSGTRLVRDSRKLHNREHRRLHKYIADRNIQPDLERPPSLVAFVGPPRVGKSTLIKSLVKRYTNQSISETNGPISVVSALKRRLTLYECPDDLSAMIDVGKVADIVVFMINAQDGFEIQTFEFLNILKTHGFTKICGVITHLDIMKKKQKQLKHLKKKLNTIWEKQLYPGAKLFNFTDMMYGKYKHQEVNVFARFISTMTPRPIIFRSNHPFIVADRFEDITHKRVILENNKCDRKLKFFGYVRGSFLKSNNPVCHLIGVGDFPLTNFEILNDPCPLPTKSEQERNRFQEESKLLYAPMASFGGLVYDKDAFYITLRPNELHYTSEKDVQVIREEESDEDIIVEQSKGIGEQMVHDLQNIPMTATIDKQLDRTTPKVEDKEKIKVEKEEVEDEEQENEEESDEEFLKPAVSSKTVQQKETAETMDTPKSHLFGFNIDSWIVDGRLKYEYTYADEESEEEEEEENPFEDVEEDEQEESDVDPEDEEGILPERTVQKERTKDLPERGFVPGQYVSFEVTDFPYEFVQYFNLKYLMIFGGLLPNEQETNRKLIHCKVKKHRFYKRLLKSNDPIILSMGWRRFQTIGVYSAIDMNKKRNRFLKVTPDHTHCMMSFYAPVCPVGTGLFGFVDTDVPTIQRTKDSVPEIQYNSFRIALTGAVSEVRDDIAIVKKLKLTGVPYKIMKKTAFIQGMFTSALECIKFKGAKIQSVSGIRGELRKPAGTMGQPGSFRATFEGKILPSDIIFLKTWAKVPMKKFYTPVLSNLLTSKKRSSWSKKIGMKTSGYLKYKKKLDEGLVSVLDEIKSDSIYTDEQERIRAAGYKQRMKMKVPNKLVRELPFSQKMKYLEQDPKRREAEKRTHFPDENLTDREREQLTLLRDLQGIGYQRLKEDKVASRLRRERRRLRIEKEDMERAARMKIVKKREYIEKDRKRGRRH